MASPRNALAQMLSREFLVTAHDCWIKEPAASLRILFRSSAGRCPAGRYCGNRAGSPVRSLHLAPDGVYMTDESPGRRCALTAPFHPYRGFPRRYLSVALALESPPPAVSRHPALRCPDFPHALWGPAAIQPPLPQGALYRDFTRPSILS